MKTTVMISTTGSRSTAPIFRGELGMRTCPIGLEVTNQIPPTSNTAEHSKIPVRGPSVAAMMVVSSGPRIQMISCSVASMANTVLMRELSVILG